MMWWKLKINMGTWYYHEVTGPDDVYYEHLYDSIIDPEYPMVNRLKVMMEDDTFHYYLITDVEGATGVRVSPMNNLRAHSAPPILAAISHDFLLLG